MKFLVVCSIVIEVFGRCAALIFFRGNSSFALDAFFFRIPWSWMNPAASDCCRGPSCPEIPEISKLS